MVLEIDLDSGMFGKSSSHSGPYSSLSATHHITNTAAVGVSPIGPNTLRQLGRYAPGVDDHPAGFQSLSCPAGVYHSESRLAEGALREDSATDMRGKKRRSSRKFVK